jgi:aspartate aminotransferase
MLHFTPHFFVHNVDFLDQCKGMADRISLMRTLLRNKLAEVGSTKDWEHVTNQIGMFAYSGLSSDMVMEMREKHHVYCTADGRISMAGVTSENVDYIANAIHDVSK